MRIELTAVPVRRSEKKKGDGNEDKTEAPAKGTAPIAMGPGALTIVSRPGPIIRQRDTPPAF